MPPILNKITIVRYEEQYKDDWDNFCTNESEAWFWHTSDRIEHSLAVAGRSSDNQSFFIVLSNEIIAVSPLIVSTDANKNYVINHSGWGTPAPIVSRSLSISNRKKIRNFVYEEIDKIASKCNVGKTLISRFPQIINLDNDDYYNDLIEFGYMNASIYTSIVDLRKSKKIIFSELRNNHRRDINKYSQVVDCEFIDSSIVSKKDVDLFKNYYFKIANKRTHPNKVFEIFYKMIKEGNAILVKAYINGNISGYTLLITYKNQAYYLLGAQNDNEYPLLKIALFKSLQYLKSIGYYSFEFGRMEFESSIFHSTNLKRTTISSFKKGFGGNIYPIHQGLKYYNQSTLDIDVDSFIASSFLK